MVEAYATPGCEIRGSSTSHNIGLARANFTRINGLQIHCVGFSNQSADKSGPTSPSREHSETSPWYQYPAPAGQPLLRWRDRLDAAASSISSLAEVADWMGADVINIHAGGAYGDMPSALSVFERNLARLSDAVRGKLTVENDDVIYTPADLLPLCRRAGLPLVYDVHHDRCRLDGLTIYDATSEAASTWDREPLLQNESAYPIAVQKHNPN